MPSLCCTPARAQRLCLREWAVGTIPNALSSIISPCGSTLKPCSLHRDAAEIALDSLDSFLRRVRRSERDVLRVRQRSLALQAPSLRDVHDGMRRAPSIGRVRRQGRAARGKILPAPSLPTSGRRVGAGLRVPPAAGGGGRGARPPRTTSSSTPPAESNLQKHRRSPGSRREEISMGSGSCRGGRSCAIVSATVCAPWVEFGDG